MGKTSFFQALNIPTKIQKGTIEIVQDVNLIKEGDKVGMSEATLLNMLNISPFTYGLVIRHVYDSGTIFDPAILDITDDDLRARFMSGVRNVAAISLQIGYPTLASAPHSIVNGMKKCLAHPSKFAAAAAAAAPAAAAPEAKKEEKKE